ncbi:MAG: sodium-dependent transporter [Acidobacteriota bacterium]
MANVARGNWNSRFGFILAAAGSAIGLGNIWRFPYTAGEYGGGAFVLLYLIFVIVIGVPVLLSELAIGRHTQQSPVSAFKKLVPNSKWWIVGFLGVLAGFGILSFYAVIAGLTVGYAYLAMKGTFSGEIDAAKSAEIFGQITGNPVWMIGLLALFMLLTILVVRRGISGGIEKTARLLMPVLLAFLVLLVVRALTLPGAGEGLAFMFSPDFSKLTLDGVVSALGQALFSLSIGMGAMITYGSYLPKDENIPVSTVSVAMFDTGIALLGGLIIFPTLFTAGADPAAGPGLIFVVMASIFNTLPLGNLVAVGFYVLLSIAALTSTISLLEVIVAYFVDERGWSREKSTWTVGLTCFALGVPSALALGANTFLSSEFHVFGQSDFLSVVDLVCGTYFLTIGAALICLFVGWKWGTAAALEAIEGGGHRLPLAPIWKVLVSFICPLAVASLLVYAIANGGGVW